MLNYLLNSATAPNPLRWLVLLVFPVVGVAALIQGMGIEPFVMCCVAFVACAFLLHRLDCPGPDTAAVWLVLAVFIGFYFLRYPIIAFDPAPVIGTHPDSISDLFRDGGVGLNRALRASVFAFTIFCVVAKLLLLRPPIRQTHIPPMLPTDVLSRAVTLLSIAAPLLMLVLGYLAFAYRIGQMGVDPGEPLPFRLKGLVFYGRLVLLPLMIMAIVHLGTRLNRKDYVWVGLLLLAIHGISDMVIRVSRSSLLLCLLLLVFMAIVGGFRVRRSGVVIGAVLMLAAIYLMPIVMHYRLLLITGAGDGFALFQQAFSTGNEAAISVLKRGLATVYFRIPGIETMWAIGNSQTEPLGEMLLPTLHSAFGMAGYLTFTLYRISPAEYTLWAPGFVGWLYLAGGYVGIAIGASVLAWICVVLPRYSNRAETGNGPLFNTFLLWVLFLCLTDGTLDSNILLLASGLLALVVWNYVLASMASWAVRKET